VLAEILQQAELPLGVVNIVTGDGQPVRRWSITRRRQDRFTVRPK